MYIRHMSRKLSKYFFMQFGFVHMAEWKTPRHLIATRFKPFDRSIPVCSVTGFLVHVPGRNEAPDSRTTAGAGSKTEIGKRQYPWQSPGTSHLTHTPGVRLERDGAGGTASAAPHLISQP